MSESDAVARARRAAEQHDSFERLDDGRYAVTTTAFDGEVVIDSDGGAAVFAITVRVPMLDAVTEDHVAPVVEDGWFDTLALRLEDVDGAFRGTDDPDVTVERDGEHAVLNVELTDLDANRAAADAVAAVEYVEGTYVEGIIPGYDYTEPVTHLIQRAASTGGGTKGGTPL
ncbi:hypothetical protein D3D02_10240 [Halobellus sp. Atlit-38R]|jgi:hypothetical protein|uniref:DUF5813 family protein n=1 Tax=Halobellus sp. Atlit-38R TaxID=2282131 RepID=UPI000EF24ECD|nr:DUF5813 family protein [Halobellus sp. Atlit-38R]RLM88895.1 hypothetical protein D3D02_10240 [Halobellus sp. Atlit-38R]